MFFTDNITKIYFDIRINLSRLIPTINKLTMACYKKEIFQDAKLAERFHCSSCKNVVNMPIQDSCGHLFGRNCFDRLMIEEIPCPVDGHDIKSSTIVFNTVAAKFIRELSISCPNAKVCSWQGKVHKLEDHLKTDCQYEIDRQRTENIEVKHKCADHDSRNSFAILNELMLLDPEKLEHNLKIIDSIMSKFEGRLSNAEDKLGGTENELQQTLSRLQQQLISNANRNITNESSNITDKNKNETIEAIGVTKEAKKKITENSIIKISENVKNVTKIENLKISHVSLDNTRSNILDLNFKFLSNFNKNFCGHGVTVISDDVARGNLRLGGLVLLNTQFSDILQYKFKILHHDCTLAIGACIQSKVLQNGYHVKVGTKADHGCFLFRVDGHRLIHAYDSNFQHDKGKFFKMAKGDIIELECDPLSRFLIIRNNNHSTSAKIHIDDAVDFNDLCACVLLLDNESIELINPMTFNEVLVQFDLSSIRSDILVAGNSISRLPFGDLALLSTPIKPCHVYKFLIVQQNTLGIALGLCYKKLVNENHYNFDFVENHGCYLFHSSGNHFRDKYKYSYTKMTPKVTFTSGDILTLVYEPSSYSLILTNQTTKGESKMPLCIKEDQVSGVYPCVWLQGADNKVRLINE